MTIAESFDTMVGLFNPAAAGSMNKTLQWNVTGEEAGKYALKVANGTCELIKGGVEKPDMTLTVADKDWLAIAEGKLDAMNAFATGKLKLAGDMMLAMKVQQLFPIKR
ncbi:MAG TPA: SCP2 sterol-binding domain-containing protein [Ktedonobacteraceae bacterium]|nr:SCP2 sterol-binding domain-containing protein [Ktedonobacteraceae bacterium]